MADRDLSYQGDCLFCRIAAGEIPSDRVFEDEQVIVFRDINPRAPTHVLAIPRRHVASAADLPGAAGGRMPGDFVLFVGLPFEIYRLTGSTLASAGMVLAFLVPSILLGSVAGVFVDRWDRRRLLVVVNLLHAGRPP